MVSNRFRWVFCQLEMLRNCLPQNVRRILRELPASLDETYERMLRELMNVNPDQVYRLLQCITVSIRPLRVEELAEILALDFDLAEEGIPVLNEEWRSDDKEQSVLSICSSLIVVVDSEFYDPFPRDCRVVQFAHFSVKEFLTSDRLANLKTDISRFHIRLEPAHTFVTQACLAILLQSDRDDRVISTSPLSKYAAQNWVGHAQFENVSLCVEAGIRRLFDPAKPYFGAWLDLHDLDNKWESFLQGDRIFRHRSRPLYPPRFTLLNKVDPPLCLYYAALCGFRDLTKHFIAMYPQHVNASVGLNKSPLVAALCNRHTQVAELLLQRGAVLPNGCEGRTLLHASSTDGLVDVTQWLLNIGLDAKAQEDNHKTPLHSAAAKGRLEIVRILLGHGAYVNAVEVTHNYTPLHEASSGGHIDVVRVLIENEADVHARDQSQSTPLHVASSKNNAETAQLLIRLGADVDARDQSQSTPLHVASSEGAAETVRILIKHGADVHARDQSQSTPLHVASSRNNAEAIQLLIKHGADVSARNEHGSTPLHLGEYTYTAQLLIEHGADIHARDKRQSTPLHHLWIPETAQLLIKHGADVHARDQEGLTPLHIASSWPVGIAGDRKVRLLIELGASVNAYDNNHQTPLHMVSSSWSPNAKSLCLLLENGADVDVENDQGLTALQIASSKEEGSRWPEVYRKIAQLLLDHSSRIVSDTM